MSTQLTWKPVVDEGELLSEGLKEVMQKRYPLSPTKVVLDKSDLDFLEGLHAAGMKESGLLIEAIGTHGKIELNEVLL